jgi:hypothetical protein
MRARRLVLFLFVVLPGLTAIVVCGHYMFSDWSALISAFARFERVAASGDARSLAIAQYLDSVYRLNAFADGVGVMLGAVSFGIGVHGLCLLPAAPSSDRSAVRKAAAAEALFAALVTAVALSSAVYLIGHVGSTNSLRRAVLRGDQRTAEHLIRSGADPRDRFWWGVSASEADRAHSSHF